VCAPQVFDEIIEKITRTRLDFFSIISERLWARGLKLLETTAKVAIPPLPSWRPDIEDALPRLTPSETKSACYLELETLFHNVKVKNPSSILLCGSKRILVLDDYRTLYDIM
jgi:hypothetical protein